MKLDFVTRSQLLEGDWVITDAGAVWKLEWLRYFLLSAKPAFRHVVQAWDTAFKDEQRNDYSVCVTLGETDTGFFVLDPWRAKVQFPELKRAALWLTSAWNPDAVLIEDAASGQSLIRELQRPLVAAAAESPLHANAPILAIPMERGKVTRAHSVTRLAESGLVFVPEDARWLQPFLDELRVFYIDGAHDDQVDAFTTALRYMRRGQPVLDFYRKQLEDAKAARDREDQGLPSAPKPPNPMIDRYRATLERLRGIAGT